MSTALPLTGMEQEPLEPPRVIDFDSGRGTLTFHGAFSLAESINFGFGGRRAEPGEAVMRMAFVLDGYHQSVGVALTQPGPDTVRLEIADPAADSEVVARQVARVLSLDVDATGWDVLGRRDGLLTRLQAARPGLRPPLFYSAYEAAAWSVLSARQPISAMMAVRDRLAAEYGQSFALAGRRVQAFPQPAALLEIAGPVPGIPDLKLNRMKAIARLALDGGLDTDQLRAMPVSDATDRLRAISGIGPFYSTLIIVRALGHTDVLAEGEPRLLSTLGSLLGLNRPASQAELERRAESWRPWRTWGTVAIRAAGPSVAGLLASSARRVSRRAK